MKNTKTTPLILALLWGFFLVSGVFGQTDIQNQRNKALEDLSTYYDNMTKGKGYSEYQLGEIRRLKRVGENAINKATIQAAINTALKNAKDEIQEEIDKITPQKADATDKGLDGITTNQKNNQTQEAEKDIQAKRTEAIKKLNTYVKLGTKEADYKGDQLAKIKEIRKKRTDEINEALTEAAVTTALENAKREIDTVDTTQEAEQKAKKLQTTRDEAIKELEDYFKPETTATDYKGRQLTEIDSIKQRWTDKINKAQDEPAVNAARLQAMGEIDTVDTTQIAAEKRLQGMKVKAKREMENYKSKDKQDLIGEINMAEDEPAVNAVLAKARDTRLQEKIAFLYVIGILLIAGIFIVLVCIVFILLFVHGNKKLNSLLKEEIKDKLENLEKKESEHNQVPYRIIQEVKESINRVEHHIATLGADIKKSYNKPIAIPLPEPKIEAPRSKTVEQKVEVPLVNTRTGDPLIDFNTWAGNPTSKLPSDFYYVSGNMQVRTEQQITESPTETQWITNREGIKYLFPNPNSFNQMTDISKLYKMDQEKLKAKGQNRIKITKPCEMSDKGYINYPGELELL